MIRFLLEVIETEEVNDCDLSGIFHPHSATNDRATFDNITVGADLSNDGATQPYLTSLHLANDRATFSNITIGEYLTCHTATNTDIAIAFDFTAVRTIYPYLVIGTYLTNGTTALPEFHSTSSTRAGDGFICFSIGYLLLTHLLIEFHFLVIFLLKLCEHLVSSNQVEKDESLYLFVHSRLRPSHLVVKEVHASVVNLTVPLTIASHLASLGIVFDILCLSSIHRAIRQYLSNPSTVTYYHRAVTLESINMCPFVFIAHLTDLCVLTSFRIPFSHGIATDIVKRDDVTIHSSVDGIVRFVIDGIARFVIDSIVCFISNSFFHFPFCSIQQTTKLGIRIITEP